MSLPPTFETPSQYFAIAVAFLEEYNWIYRTSNTRFLAQGVFDSFPTDWAEYFSSINVNSLNQFPCGVNLDKPPKTLQNFQNRLQELRPNHKEHDFIGTEIYFRGMSPKKLHEISRLSDLIGATCKSNVDILIDFGSGLGYLSEVLHKNFQFNILGLECVSERVKTATSRQRKYFPSATTNVYYRKEMITENSEEFIVKTVHELYPNINEPRLGILGLHACADLSITSIKLFFKLNQIKVLTIMPCCHHKLEEARNRSGFKHFPISEELCKITEKLDQPKDIFNKPFLRLACQQTVSRWINMSESEHREHGENMFLRAAVECLASEGETIIKSRKKYQSKNAKQKLTFKDVQNMYILKENEMKTEVNWRMEHEMKFVNILEQYQNGASLSEGLTCLQTALQEVCENIVLLDRVCFMRERAQELGINIEVQIRKITNDKLSPRSFALIAEKNT